MTRRREARTDNETGQVHDIAADREAERAGDRCAARLEEHAVRVHGLRRVLERVVRKVLPVLDHRLVLEQLSRTNVAHTQRR